MASLQWSWAYTQSPTAGSNSGWTPIPSLLNWSGLYRLIGWWSQERQPRWIAWLDSLRPPKPSNEPPLFAKDLPRRSSCSAILGLLRDRFEDVPAAVAGWRGG